jgi:hypothetical protein
LIPHFQTALLAQLRAHPQPWADLNLVKAELATRHAAPPKKDSPPPGQKRNLLTL